MRDQGELAQQCLEVEQTGGDVLEYLRTRGFISPMATWQRLQLNELRRKDTELTLGRKEEKIMKILTQEEKNKAVEVAMDGGNPFEYLKSIGCRNPYTSWQTIKKGLKKDNQEAYDRLPKEMPRAKAAPMRVKKTPAKKPAVTKVTEVTEVTEPVTELTPAKIRKPLNYDGMTIRAVEGEFGKYHFSDVNGKQWIDYEDKEGADMLSMTVEQWRGFMKELKHAAAILGVEL